MAISVTVFNFNSAIFLKTLFYMTINVVSQAHHNYFITIQKKIQVVLILVYDFYNNSKENTGCFNISLQQYCKE